VDQVPFEQVKRITRDLFADDDLLPGLIAVLSRASSADLLLVYVGPLPESIGPQLRAISADQLRDEVLTGYDGPTIGLAAVDHIRPDIGTKGQHFVRLDRILRRHDRADLLRQTWTALSDYLAAHQHDGADEDDRLRAAAEIAAIKAPAMIAELPAERRHGLVAFIPSTGEAVCLDELNRGEFPLGDLSMLKAAPDQDIITFEEIRPLIEAGRDERLCCRYPIELRTVLRRGQVDQELYETLRQLSRAFYTRWRLSADPRDRERAYATALEGRLAHRDVDDLVAVVPSGDFDSFLTEGTGTYVYRRPLAAGGTPGPAAIQSKYLAEAIEDLANPESPVVFSLLPLRELCPPEVSWCDLGPPLRKSARTEILARNAWLLVQDLLEDRESGRTLPRVSTRNLYETMVRCCMIFSLTDPGRTRQRRRDEWVRGSYETLIRVIQIRQHERSAYSGYYKALEKWYACALATEDEEVETALNGVVELLADWGAPVTADSELERAEDVARLKKVAVQLRQLLSGGARAEAVDILNESPVVSIPQVVRHVTAMAEPLDLLSVPFGTSFREYAGLQQSIRRLSTVAMSVRGKTERLAELAARLDQSRRLIFAPQHEARILRAIFDKELNATKQFIAQLRGGAAVELKLRTHSVELDEENRLVFSVRNAGSLTARDVELELAAADAFELLDLTFKQSLTRLAPEEERTVSFGIRCVTDAPDFRIRCVVSWSHGKPEPDDEPGEMAERQVVTQDFMVSTVGIEAQPFRKKPNPYQFGVHVQDHRRFFGRRAELDSLLGHLAEGRPQNVLLRAPRRAGKTSLLHMVRSVLDDTDRQTGAREWFDVPDSWDSNLNATIPVVLNLQGIETLQKDATPTAFYGAVLGGLRDAGLHSSSCDQLLNEPVIAYTQFSRAFRELVATAGSRRPVILLDEFDVLDGMADKAAFYNALRTIVTEVQGVTWIMASALGLYKEIRDYASPLFNIFKIVSMGRMETDAARRLVTSPWEPGGSLASAGLKILPDATYTIVEEAGYYPYFIQMLCSEVVDYVNSARSNQVRFSTVQQVVDRQMMNEGGAADLTFSHMWEGASPTGKLLLLTLLQRDLAMADNELKAEACRLLGNRGRVDLVPRFLAQFDDSLTLLIYIAAIRHVPGAGYAFGIPIFRRLLVRKEERIDLEAAAIGELASSIVAVGP
jgi:hypothetical protein